MSLQYPLLVATTSPCSVSSIHTGFLDAGPSGQGYAFVFAVPFSWLSLSSDMDGSLPSSKSLPYEPYFYCISFQIFKYLWIFPCSSMVVLPLIFATHIFVYLTPSVTEYVMKESGCFFFFFEWLVFNFLKGDQIRWRFAPSMVFKTQGWSQGIICLNLQARAYSTQGRQPQLCSIFKQRHSIYENLWQVWWLGVSKFFLNSYAES